MSIFIDPYVNNNTLEYRRVQNNVFIASFKSILNSRKNYLGTSNVKSTPKPSKFEESRLICAESLVLKNGVISTSDKPSVNKNTTTNQTASTINKSNNINRTNTKSLSSIINYKNNLNKLADKNRDTSLSDMINQLKLQNNMAV